VRQKSIDLAAHDHKQNIKHNYKKLGSIVGVLMQYKSRERT